MGHIYTVRPGDTLSSIGFEHGLFPDTIWRRPENAALRAERENPNVLRESDAVFIPDKRERSVAASTGKRHVFRRKGVPEVLRVRFLDARGAPRAGLSYVVSVDGGAPREGTTDGDGSIREWIAPDAESVDVVLLVDGEERRHRFLVGHLPPVRDDAGIRARLHNLGYGRDVEGGALDDATGALRQFQESCGLPQTGLADDDTRAALLRRHGA